MDSLCLKSITLAKVSASSKKVHNSRSPNFASVLLLLLLCRIKGFSFRSNPKGRVPSYTVRNSAHLNRGAKNTAEALCLIAWYYCNMSILSGCWSPSTLSAGGTWLNWIPEKGKPSPLSWGIQNGALALVYSNRELSLVLKSWLRVKAVLRLFFSLCPNNGSHSGGKFLIWHFHNSLARPLAVSTVWMGEMQLLLVNAGKNSCLERFVPMAFWNDNHG